MNRRHCLTPKPTYFRFGLLVLMLLVIGGVEQNPGPSDQVSAFELATYLADRMNDVKLVFKSGSGKCSIFYQAACSFEKKHPFMLAKKLYLRWKRNAGKVRDIFQDIISSKNDKLRNGSHYKPSTKNPAITTHTLLHAVFTVSNGSTSLADVNIFCKPFWRNICKVLKCADNRKNILKARRIWIHYMTTQKNSEYDVSSMKQSVDSIGKRLSSCDRNELVDRTPSHIQDEKDHFDKMQQAKEKQTRTSIDCVMDGPLHIEHNDDDNVSSYLRIAKSVMCTDSERLQQEGTTFVTGCDKKAQVFEREETEYTFTVNYDRDILRSDTPDSIITIDHLFDSETDDAYSPKKELDVPMPEGEDDYIGTIADAPTNEGNFQIADSDWKSIKESPTGCNWELCTHVIKNVASSVFKSCVICFTTHRVNKIKNKLSKRTPCITYYGKCKFEKCKQFIFKIYEGTTTYVTVLSSGSINHKGKPKSTQLRGYDRVMVQEDLIRRKPKALRMDTIHETDENMIKSGNLGAIKSLEVYQKAKAERNKRGDLHADDFCDLYLLAKQERNRQDNKRFLQEVSYPLKVFMYSHFQLQMLYAVMTKKCKYVLHIDSTGSVVRPLGDEFKTVYYYSGVVNINNTIVSIMDFVSVQHDVASISAFFSKFLVFSRHLSKRKLFSHIVIDFSQALLQAVLLAWNKMTVIAYLRRMFSIVNQDKYSIKTIVSVHLCCSHFMHMVSGDLSRINMEKDKKMYAKQAVAILINCSSFSEFTKRVRSVLLIFHSTQLTSSVKEAIQSMDECIISPEEELNRASDSTSSEKIMPVYKASPFYKKGLEIEREVREIIEKEQLLTNRTNPFVCAKFVSLFLSRYMPYAPLWSGFVIRHSQSEAPTRFSNANVENWFNQVKDSILERQRNLKVGRFVTLLQKRIESICKELILNIPKHACNVEKRKKKKLSTRPITREFIMDENDPNVKEKWIKKDKKPKTYFQTKFFDLIPSNMTEALSEKICCRPKEDEQKNITDVQDNEINYGNIRYNNGEVINQKCSLDDMNCTAKGYGPLRVQLSKEDYDSLKNNNYLTDLAIDAVTETLIEMAGKEQDIVYASSSIGGWIVYGTENWEECHISVKSLKTAKYLFVPYNVGNYHWCLVIADMINKTIYCLDPLNSISRDTSNIVSNVLRFFRSINSLYFAANSSSQVHQLDVDGWVDRSDQIIYPKQQDGYSCGVFIIYYMEQILKNGIMPGCVIDVVDISCYRQKCHTLLQETRKKNTLPLLTNGLVNNPDYYRAQLNISAEIFICHIHNNHMGRFLKKVFQVHYLSLFDRSWFNDCIVDYCNATYVSSCHFCFSIGESAFAILKEKPKITPTFLPVMTKMKNLKLVFIPYNFSSHYSLLVVDMSAKVVVHLDPLAKSTDRDRIMHSKLVCFFQKRNVLVPDDAIDIENFKFINIVYPCQDDLVNCGAYVVYYVSQLSLSNCIADINTEFDPKCYRKELQVRCLQHSISTINFCVLCGGKERKRHDWCQCQQCKRWLHYPCLKTNILFSDIESDTYNFICPLCDYWINYHTSKI